VIRLGLALMVLSETAAIAHVEPFWSWNTPICWTGFILFADSFVYRARGRSWIRSAPREFALLALASIPLWLVFEFYNLYLNNWNYTGLPENWWLRMFGYAWAFATIWPAIFEGAELIGVLWDRSTRSHLVSNPPEGGFHMGRGAPALSIVAGLLMLVVPFVVSPELARYLAAPVFLGFIFLLEPINRRLGAEPLDRRRVCNLLASGLVCGVLWEGWNYWAGAKWHYSVPIMERMKIFEMPLPGYFGFPPFAVECFVMYVFVRALVASPRAGRPIAL